MEAPVEIMEFVKSKQNVSQRPQKVDFEPYKSDTGYSPSTGVHASVASSSSSSSLSLSSSGSSSSLAPSPSSPLSTGSASSSPFLSRSTFGGSRPPVPARNRNRTNTSISTTTVLQTINEVPQERNIGSLQQRLNDLRDALRKATSDLCSRD
eukprot:TRINITY_DN6521_c0_g2_i1.p1 TRINITY_DN6521_c0_g2~~TRINITY_DN6521_c0_g2_i1.p1  ORF type:complete len:171 (+),score=57.96 TRINITY_DN6521_c0_g2_i1:60-515(+)